MPRLIHPESHRSADFDIDPAFDQTLEIALIPETLERTSLSLLQEGDLVNLEADCLAKMVSALLERTPPRGG